MSAYTNTYVKIDRIPKNLADDICKKVENHINNYGYFKDYIQNGRDYALKEWLDMHKEDYDYFVNECEVDPSEMTEEALTRKLDNLLEKDKENINVLNDCIEGKISFTECIDKIGAKENHISGMVMHQKDNEWYVSIGYEIFRNREYNDEVEISTVEDLILYLKQPDKNKILDFAEKDSDYGPLTEKLEERIREFYSKIGDNNFFVEFG